MRTVIPVASPLIETDDINSVINALTSGSISGNSRTVCEFEEHFAKFIGKKFGVATTNGTSALELALKVSNIKPGDEVIIPAFTIISVLQAVVKLGAIPRFTDCDITSWNMSVSGIESLINEKTKAIIAVHTYGLPVDMDPVLEIIEGRKIALIEDAAEAHGLYYKNRMCGSIGDLSTFSFYANKHITTGEGGMVLTDSAEIVKKLNEFRNLGMSDDRRFRHNVFGENLRMSGLQAALGISQTNKIQKVKDLKKKIAQKYFDELDNCELLQLPLRETNYAKNDFWVFGVVPKVRPEESLAIQKKLKVAGIETRPFFWPLHIQPCFDNNNEVIPKLKNSEYLAERGFYLPMPLDITDDEILKITKTLISSL